MMNEERDSRRTEWDRFRYIEPERQNSHEIVRILTKVLKFLSYFVLFAAILFSSVASKISFTWLSSSVKNETITSRTDESTTALIIALEVPYALAFLISAIKATFGGARRPNFSQLIQTIFVDCIQAVGVCLIAFNIQNMLDVRASVLVTSNICLLPIIVSLLFSKPTGFWSNGIWKGSSFIFGLIQLGITIFFAIKFESWEIPVGLTCCTIQFWLNFVDSESKILPIKQSAEEMKTNTAPFSALFKGITVLLFPFAFYSDFRFSTVSISNYPLFIQIGSSLVAYYLAVISCRLTMQKFAFSLALTLSTPLALLVVWLDCRQGILEIFRSDILCKEEIDWWDYLLYGLSWIVFLMVNCHIWFPSQLRMQKSEQLFLFPMFDSPLLCEGLLLNRRRFDNHPDLIKDFCIPKIFACATVWHETKQEMTQLLKSIFRMDMDYSARKKTKEIFGIDNPDLYEFQTEIFFDDAMELNENDEVIFNNYVHRFLQSINEAASSVHQEEVEFEHPARIITPYGGRLEWCLPGGSRLTVHLKDSTKFRKNKRWSQCMYIYYLLGFRKLDEQEADQTYILALDGDVDFQPEAVRVLLDKMKSNPKVGAACGRIHPIGKGPVIWYQKFEYAIGHWLQKAAEHVYGCVLCSPGCFSLFRGSALMDDNVARRYAITCTSASEFVQFDQGEDRWLCTLLLQQGYKVEYCAVADALTYAPQSFAEFYNQRRRWVPSTMFNLMDILSSCRTTVAKNDNFSYLFVAYQFLLFISSILGPATILMMIAGAYNAVLNIDLWQSYLLSIGPAIFYLAVCLVLKPDIQLKVSAVFSALYAIVMTIVTIGTIVTAVQDSWSSPNVVFVLALAGFFIITALMHPQEIFCIVHGLLYYLCIPSGYLLLPIYALCNLNIISWGTREEAEESEDEARKRYKVSRKYDDGWIHDKYINFGIMKELSTEEVFFWKQLKEHYLHPLNLSEKEKSKMEKDLKNLRNSMVLGFVMLNTLWMVVIFQLQLLKEALEDFFFITIPRSDDEMPENFEPIGLLSLSLFTLILLLQFIASVIHRCETFLHLLSITQIQWPWSTKTELDSEETLNLCKRLQALNYTPEHTRIENHKSSIAARRKRFRQRRKIDQDFFEERFKRHYNRWLNTTLTAKNFREIQNFNSIHIGLQQ
ncbi:DgyrCDS7220 [Dimorphilus gyrociliatus]|uniref:chitin synthase n=1 Tax=Dimorphilus gyrociliatus TaxID=2664684 RepID=A0A7I8VVD3_9ANNE|nr:DgyrCDS7220 [Dimorphilus gyrociliatus]